MSETCGGYKRTSRRNTAICKARVSGETLRSIANRFGICVSNVKRIYVAERQSGRSIYSRAQLAKPIDLDDDSARGIWHSFELGDGQ